MVNHSLEYGAAACDSLPPGSRVEPRAVAARAESGQLSVTGVDVRRLSAGTQCLVDTLNSHYRFLVLEGGAATVMAEGGRYCRHRGYVRIEGSVTGGSGLLVGWIGEGLSMELTVDGKRVVTSAVQSVSIVNPQTEP
jgi:hypothetical protein